MKRLSDNTDTLKKLDILASKIDMLTKVVAVSSNIQTAFKDKSKREQVKILSELELPRGIIALMVGISSDSVRAHLSQIKTAEKEVKPKDEEELNKEER